MKVTADDIQSKSSGKPRSPEVKQSPYPTRTHGTCGHLEIGMPHSQYLMGKVSILYEDSQGRVGTRREV